MTFKYNNVYINDISTIAGPLEVKGPLSEKFDKGYVRQGTSSAFLSAIQELNKLNDLYPSDKHQIEHIGQVNFVDDIN